MKKYDIILLDVDDTLLDFKQSMRAALKDTLEKYGLLYTDKIYNRYNEINDYFWGKFEQGEIDKKSMLIARFETLFTELGLNLDCSKVGDDYLNFLSSYSFVIPGAEELCKTLAKDHKLYIVTNGTKIAQKGRLAQTQFINYISRVFISEELGVQKPQKEFFNLVFSQIGELDKSRTIILGDSLSSDMQGGINGGITTCWYNPNHKSGGENCDYVITKLEDFLEVVK